MKKRRVEYEFDVYPDILELLNIQINEGARRVARFSALLDHAQPWRLPVAGSILGPSARSPKIVETQPSCGVAGCRRSAGAILR